MTARVCALHDNGLLSPEEESQVLDRISDLVGLSNLSPQARQRLEALVELSEALPVDRAFARQVVRRVAN